MTDKAREIFQNMNASELLSTASFFQAEYTSETLDVLKDVALSRGISETAIRQHRESCYAEIDLNTKCANCKGELTLDKDDFIAGSYLCPGCNVTSVIDYMDLELRGQDASWEDTAGVAVAIAGSPLGAILLSARENKKYAERRDHILDGTYWRALQELAKLKPR